VSAIASLAVIGCVAVLSAPIAAQESRPSAPPELRNVVEAYLAEREESTAGKLLEEVLRRPDATGPNVLAAVIASDAPVVASMDLHVPHKDQLLVATVRAPEGHARSGPRLPVVFDIGNGPSVAHLSLERDAVVAFVPGYTPPEFSDEGRDGFLKVLRTAAHRAHGDPDRAWLCGFSWAGHASYDVALHRPRSVRGIVPMGGGPRRSWFRLLPQLAPVRVIAFCGQNDDPELVWNLREVDRLAPKHKLSWALKLDPAKGHTLPLDGLEGVAAFVRETPAIDPADQVLGTVLADAALVESWLVRIDAVDQARVAVPARVPVSADLTPDGQRRATIAAMASKVAMLGWHIEEKKAETLLTLTPDGVSSATIFLREAWFKQGRKATVLARGRKLWSGVVAPDPKTVLSEARRTGERLRPALISVALRF
jgi:pimeloyl-ACP methyl ester carboxylesterase